jgi:erythromycin esterase-like protein
MYNGWTEPYEQTIARAERIRAAHDAAVAERERIAAENVALTRQAEARAERLDKLMDACSCTDDPDSRLTCWTHARHWSDEPKHWAGDE